MFNVRKVGILVWKKIIMSRRTAILESMEIL